MLQALQSYIVQEKLFTKADKLVLAVSSGVDSMVMLKLFQQLDYDFVVAHCNFRLRGIESDSEEIFLQDYCSEHGIELFVKHFDTREYADLEGISIEMAARKLRYDWFCELMQELSFSWIATAHHQDDLIETMLINLSRGTGIRGLTGIQPKNGSIIRPLLFASRNEILAYAAEKRIFYKNDSSNDELIYQRNIIRHKIIPEFEEINPAFRRNAAKTASILNQTDRIYSQKINEVKTKVVVQEGNVVKILIAKLKEENQAVTVLFEILHPFGFNAAQVQEIYEAMDAEAGKIFYAPEHRLVKDRDCFIITTNFEKELSRYYVEDDCLEIVDPLHLQFEVILRTPDFKLSRNLRVVDLDYDLLQFPLIIKKWEQGEYFQPLGMSGMKKISDFFIDEKLSIPEKEAAWILYSGKKVVWIIGKRIDDRYKITSKSQKIFQITISR